MNREAMELLLLETSKDLRVKVDRNNSAIATTTYLMIVDENEIALEFDLDLNEEMPLSFFISDIKNKPQFVDFLCEVILGNETEDEFFDALDKMFYDYFSIQRVVVSGDDNFDDLDATDFSFIIGSAGANVNNQFTLSDGSHISNLFTEDFLNDLRSAAES